jgi:hypothetical protein
MIRFLMMLIRWLLAAWVGGAALFVITSIAEQRSPDFSSLIRDQLATIRFPLYYLFALMTLLPGALLLLLSLLSRAVRQRKLMLLAAALVTASVAVAAVDYITVYLPLQQLITPPGQARNLSFIELHNRSRHINEVHVGLALAASLIVCGVQIPAAAGGSSSDR